MGHRIGGAFSAAPAAILATEREIMFNKGFVDKVGVLKEYYGDIWTLMAVKEALIFGIRTVRSPAVVGTSRVMSQESGRWERSKRW